MFKDFVEGIYDDDLSPVEELMEPSLYNKASIKIAEAHKWIKKSGLELKMQNHRGQGNHQTEFFLYDVENIMLLGDVKIDRRENKPVTEFMFEDDQPIEFNGKEIKVKQIAKINDIGVKSESVLIMRMHFLIHTFINLYVWDPKVKAEVMGYRIFERNLS